MFVDKRILAAQILLVMVAALFFFDVMEIVPGLIRGNITVPESARLYIFGTIISSSVYCIAALLLAYRLRKLSPRSKSKAIYGIALFGAFLVAFNLVILGPNAHFTDDIILIIITGILIWVVSRTATARY